MKRIVVYCGSNAGDDARYADKAAELARVLHAHGLGLVYGGGNVGLMGVLADEMLRIGGEVIGVIPQKLVEMEVAHSGLSELIVVNSMHERKERMFALSDACIAIPGGAGTMEELFEAFTWTQLGFHHKPVGVLNVNGFYDLLNALLENMVQHRFLRADHKALMTFDEDCDRLVKRMLNDNREAGSTKWEVE